jgi:hypothetical protein
MDMKGWMVLTVDVEISNVSMAGHEVLGEVGGL